MNLSKAFSPAVILTLLAAIPASAQSAAPAATGTATTTQPAASGTPALGSTDLSLHPTESKELNVAITPYMWLTSVSGTMTMGGISFDSSASFVNIFEDSDNVFGLMGAIDLEYKRLVFQFNGAWTYAKFSKEQGVFRNTTLAGDLKINTSWLECFGGYRFVEEKLRDDVASPGRLAVDGFVGGRMTLLDSSQLLTASEVVTLPNGDVLQASESREYSQSKNWAEMFVGARLGIDLDEHWALSLRGDIGGFGINGSHFSWQGVAAVAYRWQLDGWNILAIGGFRALSQDYTSGNFGYDMITYGPILGVQFGFSY